MLFIIQVPLITAYRFQHLEKCQLIQFDDLVLSLY